MGYTNVILVMVVCSVAVCADSLAMGGPSGAPNRDGRSDAECPASGGGARARFPRVHLSRGDGFVEPVELRRGAVLIGDAPPGWRAPGEPNCTTHAGELPIAIISAHKTASTSVASAVSRILGVPFVGDITLRDYAQLLYNLPLLAGNWSTRSEAQQLDALRAVPDELLARQGWPQSVWMAAPRPEYVDNTLIPAEWLREVLSRPTVHAADDSPYNHGDLYRLLHAWHPETLFVLVDRDVDQWAASFRRWVTHKLPAGLPAQLREQSAVAPWVRYTPPQRQFVQQCYGDWEELEGEAMRRGGPTSWLATRPSSATSRRAGRTTRRGTRRVRTATPRWRRRRGERRRGAPSRTTSAAAAGAC